MLSDTGLVKKTGRLRILLALCLSLLTHLAAFSQFGLFPSAGKVSAADSLQITLRKPVTRPAANDAARAIDVPLTLPSPPKAKMPSRDEPERKSPTDARKPFLTPEKSPPPPPEPPTLPATSIAPFATTAGASAQPNTPAALSLPGLSGSVRRAEIRFEIYSGANRQFTGTGRHLYLSENDDYYNVSVTQATGEPDVTGADEWRMDISGRVTAQGLHPVVFAVQGDVAERLMSLNERPEPPSPLSAKIRKGRMPDGLLDRQSLLYQFMQQPPNLGGGKLWLSDGVTHSLFTYRLAGFDSLPITALGGVRAIELVLQDDGGETIELWLAPEMHYLPVKVRYTDRRGAVVEQLAVSLDFSK